MSMMCLMKPFQGTICIELRASSSSLIASCQSCRPPTTGCCSSARWPRSWPSWRTTSATATSCTFVSMVRRAPQISVVTDFLYTQPRYHRKKPITFRIRLKHSGMEHTVCSISSRAAQFPLVLHQQAIFSVGAQFQHFVSWLGWRWNSGAAHPTPLDFSHEKEVRIWQYFDWGA